MSKSKFLFAGIVCIAFSSVALADTLPNTNLNNDVIENFYDFAVFSNNWQQTGTGLHTLYNVRRLFGEGFKNFVFIEIGIVDAGHFKGPDAVHELEEHVKSDLSLYESFMKQESYPVKTFSAIGTDVADEICETARVVHRQYPQSVFFAGQLVFKEETVLDRILSNKVVFVVQRRLHREGIPFIIMPLKVG